MLLAKEDFLGAQNRILAGAGVASPQARAIEQLVGILQHVAKAIFCQRQGPPQAGRQMSRMVRAAKFRARRHHLWARGGSEGGLKIVTCPLGIAIVGSALSVNPRTVLGATTG